MDGWILLVRYFYTSIGLLEYYSYWISHDLSLLYLLNLQAVILRPLTELVCHAIMRPIANGLLMVL
jgi:hypothetical protein